MPAAGSIAIPVTELSADWLADWARLVTASGGPRDTAVTYVSDRVRSAVEPLTMEEELPPADRVRRFRRRRHKKPRSWPRTSPWPSRTSP